MLHSEHKFIICCAVHQILASYPGRVGGGKHGLVYTVCACTSCVRERTVKDFVNSRLLNGMNMRAKNADFTFLSVYRWRVSRIPFTVSVPVRYRRNTTRPSSVQEA